MSYASVAAQGAPSPSEQPHPDPALLNTTPPSADNVVDDTSKVNVVPPDFRSRPVTVTSTARAQYERNERGSNDANNRSPRSEDSDRGIIARLDYMSNMARNILFRPGVVGGLLGIINVGLAATTAYSFYKSPHLRRDRAAISSTVATTLAILGIEDYAVEKYRRTPQGREEERRAKEEGTLIYRHLREQILRPGVLGGIIGAVNAVVLGAVGYASYTHWDKPAWDKRTVSAISAGLLFLWGCEGAIARKSH